MTLSLLDFTLFLTRLKLGRRHDFLGSNDCIIATDKASRLRLPVVTLHSAPLLSNLHVCLPRYHLDCHRIVGANWSEQATGVNILFVFSSSSSSSSSFLLSFSSYLRSANREA